MPPSQHHYHTLDLLACPSHPLHREAEFATQSNYLPRVWFRDGLSREYFDTRRLDISMVDSWFRNSLKHPSQNHQNWRLGCVDSCNDRNWGVAWSSPLWQCFERKDSPGVSKRFQKVPLREDELETCQTDTCRYRRCPGGICRQSHLVKLECGLTPETFLYQNNQNIKQCKLLRNSACRLEERSDLGEHYRDPVERRLFILIYRRSIGALC